MTGHYLEVAPEDVVGSECGFLPDSHAELPLAYQIWSNLGIDPYWAQIRRLGSYAITAGLVIFWSFPSEHKFLALRTHNPDLIKEYSRQFRFLHRSPCQFVATLSTVELACLALRCP